jgi:3-methyladenine DNA glycosylase AlkD
VIGRSDEQKLIMTFSHVLKTLKSQSNPAAVRGMARSGITAAKVFGWPTPALKKLAQEIGKDHDFALRLWDQTHPARAGSPRTRCGNFAARRCNEG